jgi:hypothetical protein
MDLYERVWGRVVIDPSPVPELLDPCWLWQGGLSPTGYGQIYVSARWVEFIGASRVGPHGVHRVSHWLGGGVIPEGYEIDHLCRRRHCVNPAHLEAVTPRTNTLRGTSAAALSAQQDHCIHGHPFDEQNSYWNGIQRVCRECQRLTTRRQTEKRNPDARPYQRRPWTHKGADYRRCERPGCDERYCSNGLCRPHWNEWRRKPRD